MQTRVKIKHLTLVILFGTWPPQKLTFNSSLTKLHIIVDELLIPRLTPFILGIGLYFFSLPIVLYAIYSRIHKGRLKPYNEIISQTKNRLGLTALSTISILFFICYGMFYIPYHPKIYDLPKLYFPTLVALWLVGSTWILTLKKNSEYIQFIWIFCFGAFVFSSATIGISIALESPPYHGRLINILSLKIFTSRSFINSPGVSNLLTFLPIAFMAGIFLKPTQRPQRFWIIGGPSFVISLIAALAINQRSYFITTLLVCPLINCILLATQKAWKLVLRVLLLFTCYPLLWLVNSMLTNSLWNRPLSSSLVNDGRFQMLSYWIKNFIHDPFTRIEVGPGEWQAYQWFHNFFADVHRLSGFWALVAALLLFGYIFWRLIALIRVDKHIGCFLMAIAIPVFLIMNTSVVPEGERQPFLLLLFIGLITELVLAKRKSNTVASPLA